MGLEFKCPVCNFMDSNNSDLNRHRKQVHWVGLELNGLGLYQGDQNFRNSKIEVDNFFGISRVYVVCQGLHVPVQDVT